MKKIQLVILLILVVGCNNLNKNQQNVLDANERINNDVEMYKNVWNTFLNGDTSVVNSDNFTEDVVVILDTGNIVGIEAVKAHYKQYLDGFSEIEWKIQDAFGQGDKLIKQWNFKGRHTGTFFGIPPTGNILNLSGTTVVTMKDGKIAKEHDFFDMKSMLDQLMKADGDVIFDGYQPVN